MAIKKKMFIFEDLKNLEVATLQLVLRDVDMRDLAMALKTASERLKTLLLGSISKRAAESVREEIAFMAAVKPRDIEAAQQRIIDAARAVESEAENASAEAEAQNVAA
jgi:flagellar motor switch protein FliG